MPTVFSRRTAPTSAGDPTGLPPTSPGIFSTASSDSDEKHPSITTVTPIPELAAPHEEKRFWWQRTRHFDGTAIATQPSVYDDPSTASAYAPRSDWENLHRFDPLFRWTWSEEYRLIRKIDLRIMVFACIMFMALELDRANISQAVTDNMLGELRMTTDDFNMGFTVFRLSFLCAELPSQLVSKWVGPDRWIPAQITLWSIVSMSQFWLNGRTTFLLTRALLALLQGGFIPDIILYLSYFYKHHELSLRLGFFWTAMSIADILAGFFAAGILQLRGHLATSGWRWLFMLEGVMTLVIGMLAFGLMPPSPTQTKNWFRGKKGWFSEREEKIMINRVIRDDPSKGDMHNRQPITPKLLWKSLSDYDLWPLYLIGLVFQLPASPPNQYLTLTLKGLGFDTFKTNLLIIPSVFLHMVTMMGLTYVAEIWKELSFTALFAQAWMFPFIVYIYVVDITKIDKWVAWGILTALLSYPSPHPLQVGWNSRNSNTVRSRTVSAAMYNMFCQAGGIVSANIYRSDDAPRYKRGNGVLLGLVVANMVIYVFTKLYYVWRNKRRDRKWNALTEAERQNYLETTTDEGNKRLDFRFQH